MEPLALPSPPDLPAEPPASAAPPPAPELLQTSLKLTPEQDEKGRKYLSDRIGQCRKEMGLSLNPARGTTAYGLSFSGFGVDADGWAAKRERHDAFYNGDVEWRKAYYGKGSIFQQSNRTFNIPARFARLLAAQLDGDQLSTTPFCAFMPQAASAVQAGDNARLAKAIEAYLQRMIDSSNLRDVMAEARQAALIRNDATVKVSWVRRTSGFSGPATVLVNSYVANLGTGEDGFPIMRAVLGESLQMPDGTIIGPGEPFVLGNGEHVYEDNESLPLRTLTDCQITAK